MSDLSLWMPEIYALEVNHLISFSIVYYQQRCYFFYISLYCILVFFLHVETERVDLSVMVPPWLHPSRDQTLIGSLTLPRDPGTTLLSERQGAFCHALPPVTSGSLGCP